MTGVAIRPPGDGRRTRCVSALRRKPRRNVRHRNHRLAAHGEEGYEGLSILPVPLDQANCPQGDLAKAAVKAWDNAHELGQHGYRNAQTSVIAPTGTIGLVMDAIRPV